MSRAIKDIWYALTSPEKYRDFMGYKKRHFMMYVLILVVVSGFLNMIVPASKFLLEGGFKALIEEHLPDFYVSDDEGFWIEEPFVVDEYNFFIKADSNIVHEDITDLNGQFGSYEYVIMIDQEQIYLKNPGTPEIAAKFSELGDFSFAKKDVLSYVPVMYMLVIWALVLLVLVDFGYYFITAFVVSWAGSIIASFMNVRMNGKKMFKMAVYAGTFSYLLTLVQSVVGKNIPNFEIFSLIISVGYLYFAIKEYKDSGIEELPPEEFGNREE